MKSLCLLLFAKYNYKDQVKDDEMGGHVACIGAKRYVYRFLVGKAEGKRPLAKLRHRWENNIEIVLRGIGWGGMECIHLAQESDQWIHGFCEHGYEPSDSIQCWEILEWLSDWRLLNKDAAPFSYLFETYLTMLSIAKFIQCRMMEWLVYNEWERIRKEAVVASLELSSRNLTGETEENCEILQSG
jgi:hypothetical protein